MLRDNLVGLIEPMLSSAGANPLALCTPRKKPSDDRPPCLENPRPEGAESTLTETPLLHFTLSQDNPYPARFMTLNGVPWTVAIECGDNPFLLARLVDDFTVESDKDGKETPTWKERPKT